MSNAMAGLDGTIVNTALPAIIANLHGIQYMGWIVAIFLLTEAVSTPLWSKFGERKGNKLAYMLSTFIFGFGGLIQGLAPNMICFILARGLMGIGAGGMNTIPFIIYAHIFKNIKRREEVIGIATASFSTASILGPVLGGWLVDTFSWRWIFFINIPVAIISILLIQIFYREKVSQHANVDVDYLGSSLLVLGLVLILSGVQLIGQIGLLVVIALLVAGFILILWFAQVEKKADDPIIPGRLFKQKQLVLDFLLFIFLWGSQVAFNVYLPIWAQGLLGLSAFVGGMTQIPGAIFNFVGSEIGPNVQYKIGNYRVVLLGSISFIICFLGLVIKGQTASYPFLLLMGAFQGLGIGLSFSILQVACQSDAEPRDMPAATSFAFLARILSQTFMSAIYSAILNQALLKGVVQSHHRITMGMLNKISDANAAKKLSAQLIAPMRKILFSGINHIMIAATLLAVVAILILLFGGLLKKQRVED